MLTKSEMARLAPHLAAVRAARQELGRAEQAAADARARMKDHQRGATGWARWIPSVDPAYGDLRQVRSGADAEVAAKKADREEREDVLDGQLEPLMPRLDRRYEAIGRVVEACAHAQRECRAMRQPMDVLVATVRAATGSGRDAEAAVFRYQDHLGRARAAARAVTIAVDPARKAKAAAGVGGPHLGWDDGLFDRLPATADDPGTRRRLTNEQHRLRHAEGRLHQLEKDLDATERRAEREQRTARVRARERLLKA